MKKILIFILLNLCFTQVLLSMESDSESGDIFDAIDLVISNVHLFENLSDSEADSSKNSDDPYNDENNTTFLSYIEGGPIFQEDEECIICRDPLKQQEISLSCTHNHVHYNCLARWMLMQEFPTCPICRKFIWEKDDI